MKINDLEYAYSYFRNLSSKDKIMLCSEYRCLQISKTGIQPKVEWIDLK